MGHRAFDRGPHLLGVFPQITGSEFALACLPLALALGELFGGKLHVERTLHRIDLDDVAVADEADRAAGCRFRSHMADAEAAGRTGETSVGDQRNFFTGALAVERGRRRKHFAHAGAATRSFVADHQHFALFVLAMLDCIEAGLLAVEAARRAAELQRLHAGDFHDRAIGCEITLEPNHAAGRQQRFVGRMNDVLIRIPFHVFQIFGDRAAGDCQAIAVQEPVVEQSLH